MTQTTESGINGGFCCYRKHSMGPQAGAAACKCYCHKNGAPRTWNGQAIQAPNIPAPKPAAIVAECWTCPERGDGYPGTVFFRESLSSEYPDSDFRSLAYHRAAGHDVRPVAEGKVTR